MKELILKTDDDKCSLVNALSDYGVSKYQGRFKEFDLRVYSSATFANMTYWFAVKDGEVYVDRGLTGLLEYIEKAK